MAFLFDHLTAILVGGVLLVGLLFVQQRGNHSAVEASIRYRAEVQATSFVETLARDMENARTKDQARTALGPYEDDALGGATVRALSLHPFAGSTQTEWVQFVTLANPDVAGASELIGVAYRMEPTGDAISASGETRPLHRIVRYVYDGTGLGTGAWVRDGASPPTAIGFEVVAVPGGTSGRITTLPPRADVTVEMAFATPGARTGDQGARAEGNLTRQGATARIYAAGTGSLSLPAPQGSAEIPRLPWVGPAPPPSLPPPGGGLPSGPTGGTTSSGGSTGGGGSSTPSLPFDTTGTSAGGL